LLRAGQNPTTLTYKLPTTITVPVGDVLPGTNIRYQGMSGESARVLIDDQEALKRKGDSLDWKGTPLPGVSVEVKSRIAWYTDRELHTVGTAKIVVEQISPRAGAANKSSPMQYSGPVAYGLAKGATIPGSSVTFVGKTAEGAQLGGMAGYPYRKLGDSVVWEGMLRDRMSIHLELRVLQFDEKSLRVGGLVTLWIGP